MLMDYQFGRWHFHLPNGTAIYAYGIIIALGMLAAFLVALYLFKTRKFDENNAYLALLVCIPLGIIGARLYYIIFDGLFVGNYPTFWSMIDIRSGGMAIYGGVIGGALGIFIVSRIKKCSFFALADIGAVVLILAQGIGRWGNFANQEAYGWETGDFHFFPLTVWIERYDSAFLATFFYESLLNFIGFGVLLYIFLKKRPKWGTMMALYLIWYGVSRALVEPFRTDSLLMFGSSEMIFNRVSFVLSLVLAAAGVVLLIACKKGWISQKYETLLKTETQPEKQEPKPKREKKEKKEKRASDV